MFGYLQGSIVEEVLRGGGQEVNAECRMLYLICLQGSSSARCVEQLSYKGRGQEVNAARGKAECLRAFQ